MWYLFVQISLLLVLAALLGAGLAWWWLRRRYEDVTETHERLVSEAARAERLTKLASTEELKAGVATISTAIADIKPTDLEPVLERLQRLEQIVAGIRMPDLQPIEHRLATLTDPVSAKLSDLAREVAQRPPPDLGPVEQKINALEQTIRSIRIPAPDLGPVHSGIATLQLAIDKIAAQPKGLDMIEMLLGEVEAKLVALGGLGKQVEGLSTSVGALHNTDLEPLAGRLAAVEQAIANFHIPPTDLRPLHASMIDLERAVMDKPPVDLAPLHSRVAAVQTALASVHADLRDRHAIETLERRVASLQEAVQGIPEPDLAPLAGAVSAMEARLDLGALENRLTAIEYGVAALHHTLRSRPEAVATRTETSWQRPVVNGPAQKPRMPAPQRPPHESDPINVVRRGEGEANLLTDPAFGPPDDLEQIHGVGPMLRELLNEIGVYYFWQVAEWTPEEATLVDSRLMHFKGRIRRDDWIDHARMLATAPTAARRPAAWETQA